MSDDDDLGRAAEAYWRQLSERGTPKATPWRRIRRGKSEMPDDSDPTNPLPLIVQALRVNADATQALAAELQMARQTTAEAERKMAMRANTTSAEIRSLALAVQNLTASQAALERLKSDRYI